MVAAGTDIKKELLEMFKHIQLIRVEIASIKCPNDHFLDMSDQLDAIIEATAGATDEIMTNIERINEIAFDIKGRSADEATKKDSDEIVDRCSNIIVACSFQDITGQRVSKVVKALRHVEGRINSLISHWGEDAITQQKIDVEKETDEYKKYLNGPQLKGLGVSQADVDAMLGVASGTAPANAPAAAKPASAATPAKPAAPAAPAPKAAEPAAKPAPAAAAKPAPAPAPAAKAAEPADAGPAMDQSAVDALFG